MAQQLSEDELRQIVSGLAKLDPGLLPFEIFHQFARLAVMPVIEVVPFRTNPDGNIEILLISRSANDPNWPNQLHVPGTVIRSTDQLDSYKSAFHRIFDGELQKVKVSEPVFVQNLLHHSGRGVETSQIHWVEVYGES